MLHACALRFDVTINLEKFFGFRDELNKPYFIWHAFSHRGSYVDRGNHRPNFTTNTVAS